MNRLQIFVLVLFSIAIVSCTKEQDLVEIENPETYTFSRDGVNTVDFSGQTTRIAMATELVKGLLDFNIPAKRLVEMYSNQTASNGDANPFSDAELNSSEKSVQSKVAASYDLFNTNNMEAAIIKTQIEAWITHQVLEVYPNNNQLATVGIPGQLADGSTPRYVNAKGLEYNEAINKSLIGALFVDQICNHYLSPSVLDADNNISDNNNKITVSDQAYTQMEHKWDEAYGYLFGLSTDASQPLASLGIDLFLNKYLARMEGNSTFSGISQEVFDAFKLGRAAIVAGDYDLRDKQAEIIKEHIATVIGVRAVYYLQTAKIGLAKNDLGGAFHDLSEGYGFIYSLRFIRSNNNELGYFSREEVDGMLEDLMSGNGFWDIDNETLDRLSETIASKFDFTIAQSIK